MRARLKITDARPLKPKLTAEDCLIDTDGARAMPRLVGGSHEDIDGQMNPKIPLHEFLNFMEADT